MSLSVYLPFEYVGETGLTLNGGATVSPSGYMIGSGYLKLDASGQFVTFNSFATGSTGLSVSFWMRVKTMNPFGNYNVFEFSNGSGGNNKIMMGLQNNSIYTQIVKESSLGTLNFTPSASVSTLDISGSISSSMAVAQDNKTVLWCDTNNGRIYYRRAGLSSTYKFITATNVKSATVTNDGSRLVWIARNGGCYYANWNSSTSLFDSFVTIDATARSYSSISMTDDGITLLFTIENSRPFWSVWNGTSYSALQTNVSIPISTYFSADIVSDGNRIAYIDSNGKIYTSVWNNALSTYTNHTQVNSITTYTFQNVRFSKDGNILFVYSGSSGLLYTLWNGSSYNSTLTAVATSSVPTSVSGLSFIVYSGYFSDNVNYFNNNVSYSTDPLAVGLNSGFVTDISGVTAGTNGFALPNDSMSYYSVQWMGYFKPDISGTWTFWTSSDDASYLWIGDNAAYGYTAVNANINNAGAHATVEKTGTVTLIAGVYYPLRIQYGEQAGGDVMIASFQGPAGSAASTKRTNGAGFYFPLADYSLQTDFSNNVFIGTYGASPKVPMNVYKTTYSGSGFYSATNFNSLSLNDNVWRHYVWTMDPVTGGITTYKYYIDGLLVYTDASSGYVFPKAVTRTLNTLGVGTDLSLSYFQGGIDDFRVYNNVLSSFDINNLYSVTCFREGTKILALVNDTPRYVPIETLKKGDLVQTYLHGFKPISIIHQRNLQNPSHSERIQERLYHLTKENYPDLFTPLYLTGCHAILSFSLTEEQRQSSIELFGKVYVTDGKYRLFACLDERAIPYTKESIFTVYHFALEDDDPLVNYGVYANGLLVESASLWSLQKRDYLDTV